jgi:hypothetical protein
MIVTSNRHKRDMLTLSNTDFMQNRLLKDKPNILVYHVGFPMPNFAVRPDEIRTCHVFMRIIFNHGIFGCTEVDKVCYSSFKIENCKRQIVQTLLLSKILGDIK